MSLKKDRQDCWRNTIKNYSRQSEITEKLSCNDNTDSDMLGKISTRWKFSLKG